VEGKGQQVCRTNRREVKTKVEGRNTVNKGGRPRKLVHVAAGMQKAKWDKKKGQACKTKRAKQKRKQQWGMKKGVGRNKTR